MHFTNLISFSSAVLALLATFPTPTETRCCRGPHGGIFYLCWDDSGTTPCCGYKKCNGHCCACKGTREIQVPLTYQSGTTKAISSTVITAPPGTMFTCRLITGVEVRSGRLTTYYGKGKTTKGAEAMVAAAAQVTTTPASMMDGEELEWSYLMKVEAMATATAGDTFETGTGAAMAMAMATETATPASGVIADGPMVTAAPVFSEFMETQRDNSECEATFGRMSNGTGFVDLEGYLDYFGVPLHETEIMETGEMGTATAPAVDFGDTTDVSFAITPEDPRQDQQERARFRAMLIKHFAKRDVNGDGFLDKAEMDTLM